MNGVGDRFVTLHGERRTSANLSQTELFERCAKRVAVVIDPYLSPYLSCFMRLIRLIEVLGDLG